MKLNCIIVCGLDDGNDDQLISRKSYDLLQYEKILLLLN